MFCVQRQMQTSREGKIAAIPVVIFGTFLQAEIIRCLSLQQEKEVNLLSRTWCIFEVQVLLSKHKSVHFQVWSPVVVDQLYRQVRWLSLRRQEEGENSQDPGKPVCSGQLPWTNCVGRSRQRAQGLSKKHWGFGPQTLETRTGRCVKYGNTSASIS